MKVYRGFTGGRVEVVEGDKRRPLPPRHDLRDHSPDGFSWGYSGSGCAQLALAILADFLGNDARALRLYHDFKFRVIAGLRQNDGFELDEGFIRTMVERIEREVA